MHSVCGEVKHSSLHEFFSGHQMILATEFIQKTDFSAYDDFHNCSLYDIYPQLPLATNMWALLRTSFSQHLNVQYEDPQGQIYAMKE